LVPDEVLAEKIRSLIATEVGCEVFDATQLESSKQPFIACQSAVAVVANRYDGIDLIEDDCRLLMADGLPGGANLQERFFVLRVTAQQLLDDRILTRLVQGFGRCTRSPNDYAAVVILGETLNSYLFKKERREFFHPEIQAELEFGIEQSKDASVSDLIEYLNHFFARDAEWEGADQAILSLREGLTQKTLASSKDLADAVSAELAYQYALWNADFTQALEHCLPSSASSTTKFFVGIEPCGSTSPVLPHGWHMRTDICQMMSRPRPIIEEHKLPSLCFDGSSIFRPT
jgi:hypothetical protein